MISGSSLSYSYAQAAVKVMFSYKDQISIIEKIRVAEGEHKTLDCPFCGGRNKFTIDRFDGVLVWNCFRASCMVKGSMRGKRDLTALKNYVGGKPTTRAAKRKNPLPGITTAARKHPDTVKYLQSVNSYEAYENGLIKVRYSPADNRVLFYTPDGQGAVGRALDSRLPKWWVYGDTSYGIPVGSGSHAVLVEDVASACSVSRVPGCVGYALLGTNLTNGIKSYLNRYQKVTLVLDNDASAKAVSMAQKYAEIDFVRLTDKDLKWLTLERLQRTVQCP